MADRDNPSDLDAGPSRRGVGLQPREPPTVGGEGAETLPRGRPACQRPRVATSALRPTMI